MSRALVEIEDNCEKCRFRSMDWEKAGQVCLAFRGRLRRDETDRFLRLPECLAAEGAATCIVDQFPECYVEGYETAVREIAEGKATYEMAKERDIHLESQDARIDWDKGYWHACVAYRLGNDPADLAKIGCYTCSGIDDAGEIERLLGFIRDLKEGRTPTQFYFDELRPDPRDALRSVVSRAVCSLSACADEPYIVVWLSKDGAMLNFQVHKCNQLLPHERKLLREDYDKKAVDGWSVVWKEVKGSELKGLII